MAEKKNKMPEVGIDRNELLNEMEQIHKGDANWKDGKTWSLVYYAGDEHMEFIKKAYTMFFSENGLNPMAFPSLKKFENEVISMAADMLGGDGAVAGNMTTGGTESILMAVKTYRQRARDKQPQIKAPEMIVPESVHPAFEKAAHYFDVKTVRVPVASDFRADVEKMKAAVTENTILMVGSAPCYPYGKVDPIEELSSFAAERGIGFHVDACLGGFLLPFVKELGYPVPAFDFSVPGVTSISADIHKYGFAAKGASTVLYRNPELRKYQFFVFTDWCGGIYASPTMTGTRAGGSLAAAWATMKALGRDGYRRNAEIIMKTAKLLIAGVNSIPGLRVLGKPDTGVFAFASDEVDMFAVGDTMEKKYGWHLDMQPDPRACHMMVTMAHEKVVEPYLADLKDAVEFVRANPSSSKEGSAAMYGMMATIPDRGMAKQFTLEFLNSLYGSL
ncbi:MAG TPA: aspartate aminotransferase family protein [bacterium]|nr:aspartate aminotransferase family protein [bacterium]